MMKRMILSLFLFLWSAHGHAVQRLEANADEALQVTASMSDVNVISISGGSIESGWSMEDKVALDKNEDTGQIIFRPVSRKPFTLFVQSEAGVTYTLSVVPRDDIIGQVIVIDEFNQAGEVAAQRSFGIIAYKSEVKRLLKQIEQASLAAPGLPRLRGFRVRMINKAIPLWRETRIVHAVRWRRGDMIIDRYIVTNVSSQVLHGLKERQFKALGNDIRAIALRKLNLEPGESTLLYAIRSAS